MEEPIDIVFAEVYEILKNIDKYKVMRISKDILVRIEKERNKNIEVNIDWNRPLEEQHFCNDTVNILGYFNNSFWNEEKIEKLREEHDDFDNNKVDSFDSKNLTGAKKNESEISDNTIIDTELLTNKNINEKSVQNALMKTQKKGGFLEWLKRLIMFWKL